MALTKVTSDVRTLGNNEVGSAQISDNAVTSSKISDDAVTESKIANNSVSSAKLANDSVGLAALASQTDGSLISFDASTNPTLISPGTLGHILTSAGAGAVPSFQAPATTSTLVHLQSLTASNNTTITMGDAAGSAHFANSSYKKFFINGYDIDLTADSPIQMQFGTGSTPTIDTATVYGYASNTYNTNSSSSSYHNNDGGASNIAFSSSQHDASSTTDASFYVELINPANSDQHTMAQGWFMFGSINEDDFHRALFFGVYERDTAVTAVRFLLSSGNFETGEFRLYGLKDS